MNIKPLLRSCLLAIALAFVLLTTLLIYFKGAKYARCSAARVSCISNGKAIYFGINLYIEKYGQHPPQVVIGPEGKPWHSWRVLLLEFLDPALYQQYSFTEPWDGPKNSRLLPLIPSYYRCPLDLRPNTFFTSYVATQNAKANFKEAWPWNIIESRNNVLWMAPCDGTRQNNSIEIECAYSTKIDFWGSSKGTGGGKQSKRAPEPFHVVD